MAAAIFGISNAFAAAGLLKERKLTADDFVLNDETEKKKKKKKKKTKKLDARALDDDSEGEGGGGGAPCDEESMVTADSDEGFESLFLIGSLLDAAREADAEEVARLLVHVETCPNLVRDAREPKTSFTPLHYGASLGEPAIVASLLNAGADPNTPDKYGKTALHLAAKRGHLEVVRLLLRPKTAKPWTRAVASPTPYSPHPRGAGPPDEDEYDDDAFGAFGDGGAVLPLGGGSHRDLDSAQAAAVRSHAAAAASGVVMTSATPLMMAAMNDHVDCMHALLGAGFVVDERNALGETALHVAAAHGRTEACRVLLDAGADPHARQHGSHGPAGPPPAVLRAVETLSDSTTVGLSDARRSSVGFSDARQSSGERRAVTPAEERRTKRSSALDAYDSPHPAELLPISTSSVAPSLAVEVNIDALPLRGPSAQGHTPLHCATMRGHQETALLLVSRGADAYAPNATALRQTSVELAASCGHQRHVNDLAAAAARTRRGDARRVRQAARADDRAAAELAALTERAKALKAQLATKRNDLDLYSEQYGIWLKTQEEAKRGARLAQERARRSRGSREGSVLSGSNQMRRTQRGSRRGSRGGSVSSEVLTARGSLDDAVGTVIVSASGDGGASGDGAPGNSQGALPLTSVTVRALEHAGGDGGRRNSSSAPSLAMSGHATMSPAAFSHGSRGASAAPRLPRLEP